MPKLHQLEESTSGVVTEIKIEGAFAERLRGMGFFPGREIRMIRRGSPLVVQISGGRIALAGELAGYIEVESQVAAFEEQIL